MSVMDLQFEIDQERARKAASADIAWKVEGVLFNALMDIYQGKSVKSPIEIADEALQERNNIMRAARGIK